MKNKKILCSLVVGLSLTFVLSPIITSAQTASAEALQAQIADLLAQIKALQAQLAAQQGQTPTTESWCHEFTTNMKIGDYGTEVGALTAALNKEGLIERGMTSSLTYDETTASAVSAFQERYAKEILKPNGLSAGTGYVGAATRAKLNALYECGVNNSTIQIPTLTMPVTGATFNPGSPMMISWVGGTPSDSYLLVLQDPNGGRLNLTDGGILSSAGSYTWNIPANIQTGNYLVAVFAITGKMDDQSRLSSWRKISIANVPVVTGSNVVINGVSGPTTLDVNQWGTWTVKATGPSGSNLSYSVVWGDEASAVSGLGLKGIPTGATEQQTATFTHSYSRAGTYNVAFYVIDTNQQFAQAGRTNITVNVGNTAPYIALVSPNGGETFTQSNTSWPSDNRISWSGSMNFPTVSVFLMSSDGKSRVGVIWSGTPTNTNSIGWDGKTICPTIDSFSSNNCSQIKPGQYKIFIAGYPNGIYGLDYYTDISDAPFTITSSQTTLIKVLSPNGGETFTLGKDSISMEWTPAFPGVSTIMLIPKSTQGQKVQLYGPKGSGDPTNISGAFVYKLPNDLGTVTPGEYYISLIPADGSLEVHSNSFTIASPVTTIPPVNGKYSIAGINGQQGTYAPGANIIFTVKGVEYDGSPASEQNGFNIQAHLYNAIVGMNPSFQAVNGTYDPLTGLWTVKLTAPTDKTITYEVNVGLYCGNIGLGSVCAQRYGTNANQNAKFQFLVSDGVVQVSTITVTSPNGGEVWKAGETKTFTWSTKNYPTSSPVDVRLLSRSGDGSTAYPFTFGVVQDFGTMYGTGMTWSSIPSTLLGDNYFLEVGCVASDSYTFPNGCKGDSSDGPFTIMAPIVPLTITTSSNLPAMIAGSTNNPLIGLAVVPLGTPTNQLNWAIVAGNLPPGMFLSASDGGEVIAGIPTVAGTYTFTIQALLPSLATPSQATTKQFTLTVYPAPVITPTTPTTPTTPGGTLNKIQQANILQSIQAILLELSQKLQ